jgi:hypothetical protein
MHEQAHPLAGQMVELNGKAGDLMQGEVEPGAQFRIEDWADRVFQNTWQAASMFGNWAAKHYGLRAQANGLPIDDEVLYGKIGALGHVVHVSEIT